MVANPSTVCNLHSYHLKTTDLEHMPPFLDTSGTDGKGWLSNVFIRVREKHSWYPKTDNRILVFSARGVIKMNL
jgi:hypothetical protein